MRRVVLLGEEKAAAAAAATGGAVILQAVPSVLHNLSLLGAGLAKLSCV
jgi:hypothetical protein